MARFTPENLEHRRARSSAATRVTKSALIPLLHLAQEQDGYVTDDAMEHIAELVERHAGRGARHVLVLRDVQARAGRAATSSTSARTSRASCSAARSCCTTPSTRSASRPGGTTADGLFTSRTSSASPRAPRRPCLQVNYRYFHRITPRRVRPADRRPARRSARRRVPPHGTLARVRQHIPADARAPATSRPTDRRASRCGCRHSRRPTEERRAPDGRHRRAEDHHQPLRATTTATRSRATCATGGYEGPAAALAKTPDSRSPTRSRRPALLGRGGAGFPAGVKWGFCPAGVWPRYLVVNGDESEPGTYKDRLLMERDPHQLIEGILIACYAVGCRPGLPLRPRRDGPRPGAHRRRRSTRPTPPATSASNILGTDFSRRHRPALGRRRLHRRRGDGAHRDPRGQPRHAPPQAAVLPGGQGPLPAAHHRQQRRDAVEPAVDRDQRRPTPAPRSAPRRPRAPACSRCRATSSSPGVYEVEFGVTTFRDLIYGARLRRRHPRRPRAQGVHPRRRLGAVVLRGAPRPPAREGHRRQGRLHARLGRHRRDGRDHRHGQGLPAPGALLRPRVVRQVHAVPRGHHVAGADPRAHPRRPRPARGPRPAARRLRQHLARASPGRPSRPPSARSGQSATTPVASAVMRFQDEFEALRRRPVEITVAVKGPAFVGPSRDAVDV